MESQKQCCEFFGGVKKILPFLDLDFQSRPKKTLQNHQNPSKIIENEPKSSFFVKNIFFWFF